MKKLNTYKEFINEAKDDDIKKFKVSGKYDVWVRRIDSTHAMVSNSEREALNNKGGVYHVIQLEDEPYYDEMIKWLKK